MALNIESDEAHRLARELAEAAGTSMTVAVTEALRRALEERAPTGRPELLVQQVAEIQRFVRDLLDRDLRTPDEILGYDGTGLPG